MASRPDMAMVVATATGGGGPTGGGGGSSAAVRPGSMTERARLAKIPQPEQGLKCPRPGCESTNTKFCYFNNYSLSQPRHFCKTCRRYWTRGGALRNVPVGGGCRRNKRTKSSKSSNNNSSSAASASATSSSTSSPAATGSGSAGPIVMPPQLPFQLAASLHHQFGGGDHYGTTGGASRLGFPGLMSSLDPVDYQLGTAGGAAIGFDHWRLPQIQQFPFFSRPDGGVPPPMSGSIYPFDAEGGGDAAGFAGQMLATGSKVMPAGSSGLITQLASVKMEDNPPSTAMTTTSSPREFLGLSGSLQFWSGGNNGAAGGNTNNNNGGSANGGAIPPGSNWVDLSGFNPSSSGNIL
ncbi:hypothetical protein PR202_gb10452 [Eleusine coracana subsp. coracana]|uniref:Dof zinc finger protein n=1 Tax=Eleusine coracana subsp. coracana TaxID=191504 RepID=A0AAV5EKG4_ELECO|nr:hypothetical protein PR202_gb10452 [Eleusine coracana subsp. coracana]